MSPLKTKGNNKKQSGKNEESRLLFETAEYKHFALLALQVSKASYVVISDGEGNYHFFKRNKQDDIPGIEKQIEVCLHEASKQQEYFEIKGKFLLEFLHSKLPLLQNKPGFFCSVPVKGSDKSKPGQLCFIYEKEKKLKKKKKKALTLIASQIAQYNQLQRGKKEKKEEKNKLETILANLTDVIYELNHLGEFTFFNKSVKSVSGYRKEELLGKHFTFLVHEEDKKRVADFYRKQIKDKVIHTQLAFRIRTKKGNAKWVNQSVTIKYHAKNTIQHIIAIVRDITNDKKTRELLTEKTQLLETVISTMVEGVLVFDQKGNFLLHNKAIENLINFNPEHSSLEECIMSHKFYEEDQETLLPDEKKPSAKVLNGEAIKNSTLYLVSSDNKGSYLNVNAQPLISDTGKVVGGIIVLSDIDDIKNKEYELIKINSLIEQAKDIAGIGHWEVDLEKGSVFWSEATRRIHEVDENYEPNLEEGINFYDEESQPLITAAIERAIREKSSWDLKLKIITARKNLRWVRAIGKAYGKHQKVTKLFGIFQDITEEKEFQDSLLKSRERIKELNLNLEKRIKERTKELEVSQSMFQKLYNNAPDMLLSIDPNDGAILECNQTTLKKLGYTKTEFIGKHIKEFYDISYHDKMLETMMQLREKGKVENKKLYVIKKNGEKIPIRLNVTVEKNKKGEIIRTNSVWRDISQLEKAEKKLQRLNEELEHRVEERTAQLQKVNEELEEFTYITTHDLKSPLSNMEGYVNLMEMELSGEKSEIISQSLHFLQSSIKLAKNRIEGIVEVARVSDPISQVRQEFNFSELVQTIIKELDSDIKQNQTEIKTTIAVNKIISNPYHWKSILYNIISNAIKYKQSDIKSKVKIEAECIDQTLSVTIKDNGMGMNLKKNIDKLFGMFTRYHDHIEGSGLGMHITKKMIESMNGTIEVKSGINKGTTFIIKTPIEIV